MGFILRGRNSWVPSNSWAPKYSCAADRSSHFDFLTSFPRVCQLEECQRHDTNEQVRSLVLRGPESSRSMTACPCSSSIRRLRVDPCSALLFGKAHTSPYGEWRGCPCQIRNQGVERFTWPHLKSDAS